MAELADKFRKTRAKSVICILDCCFSGGAPARVIDPTPYSRDLPFGTEAITGKGKVMITASGLDQPAYEHPILRQGILTHSIIQALCGSTKELPLLTVMEQVIEQVRSMATSLGCNQTPVIFNLIEGGLTIQPLTPGRFYHTEFPEKVGIKVGADISELLVFGLPEVVIDTWRQNFIEGLNSLQLEAINDFHILEGESLLVVAPTSSGKTFVGELAAIKAIIEGRKAIFLLPYRALVNEKFDQFTAMYQNQLHMRVIRCSGDYLDDTTAFLKGKFDIAVLTYEMFLSLAVSNPALISRVGLVVLDEAQFITDEGRGITVEMILTRLKVIRKQGISPQLITLSATMGPLNRFDEWLGIRCLVTDFRPIPLEIGVLDRGGTYEYVNAVGDRQNIQLLAAGSIVQRGSKPSAQDVLVPLAQQLMSDDQKQEKLLVFRNTRGAAEGCANYLSKELGLSAATEVINSLPINDLSNSSSKLRSTLSGGVAFHNSNLARDERVLVERSFRDPQGNVKILVATTTVAAGINTPASTVILVEHDFPWENKLFSVAEVKNMAGRAGRLGFRETGRAIILADTPYERHQLFQKYVLSQPEEVRSSFQVGDVSTWLLRLLAQVPKVKAEDLISLIINTYGGFLAAVQDPNWQQRIQIDLSQLVNRMKAAELLLEEDGYVSLSLLGRICGESSLSLSSAIQFIQLLKQLNVSSITHWQLMALVQALPELDDQYTPLFRKGQREAIWPYELAKTQGDMISRSLQYRAVDLWQYYARAKRACILQSWVKGEAMESIESRYTANPFNPVGAGDVRGIADTTRFHLRSVINIVSILLPGQAPDIQLSDQLLRQIELGIPQDALPLLILPFRFTRGEYLALVASGINSPENFWSLPYEKLNGLLGQARGGEIERYRTAKVR